MSNPEQTLFATLDAVPWADLTHAYGSAADIPEHLRLMLSPDQEVRDGIFESFYGNIFHQGSVYPATVAAIPFFIEAVQHPRVPDRDRILVFLAHLAVGYPKDCVLRGFDTKELLALGFPRKPGRYVDDADEEGHTIDPEYGDLMRQCYAAVGAGCPVYANLLEASTASLRHSAAFLLAWFPAHAWSAIPKLLDLARHDPSSLVRCSSLLALSYLAGPTTRPAFLQFVESRVTSASAGHVTAAPIAALDAAAGFCLLRELFRTRDHQVPEPLRLFAERCLREGIDYSGLPSAEEPTVEFHWGDLTHHLQRLIRKLMKKPKRRKSEDDDE